MLPAYDGVSNLRNKYRAQAPTKETSSSQTSSHQLQESALTPSSHNTDRFAWLVIVMKLIKVPGEAIPQHPSCSASCNNHFHLSQNRTEWFRSEGITGGHPAQPHCSSRVPLSTFLRTVSRWLWNIPKEWDSTAERATCCSAQFTLTIKFYPMFRWNSPESVSAHCCPSCPLALPRRAWLWKKKHLSKVIESGLERDREMDGRGHLSNRQVWWHLWTHRDPGHIQSSGKGTWEPQEESAFLGSSS